MAWVQVQGRDRELVAETGRKLGLEGSYIPRSYIEQARFLLLLPCAYGKGRPHCAIVTAVLSHIIVLDSFCSLVQT